MPPLDASPSSIPPPETLPKKEKLLLLADTIERGAIPNFGFNMRVVHGHLEDKSGRGCNTVGCIAGWAVHLFPSSRRDHCSGGGMERAGRLLSLTSDEASLLFLPLPQRGHRVYDATPACAARVLRHFAYTGQIDWTLSSQAKP